MFAPAQKIRGFRLVITTTRTSGCSKRSALDGIGKFDIDTEVVGIELEFVAFGERLVLLDVHGQGGDRP